MSEEGWFRVHAVLQCAFEPDDGGMVQPRLPVAARPASTAARAALRRVDRGDAGLRDVARAIIEALGSLEQEVERLRLRLDLHDIGLDLDKHLVEIGADGLTVQRDLGLPPGQRVRAWLELPLDGQDLLVSTPARVLASLTGTSLIFEDIPTEVRDRIVAFAFQQQAMERRRARERAR